MPLAEMRHNKPAVYKSDKSATKKLRYAVFSGDIKAAKKLLRKGGDLEGEDADCYTPVLIAARWNRIDMDYTSVATDVARKLDLPEAVPPPPAAGADG